MATLNRQDVERALARLGELAQDAHEPIELLLLGGGVMMLVFGTRQATRDVDVVILPPSVPASVRALAKQVGDELDWPADWLNDAAKGFMVGVTLGPVVFSSPGIVVRRPSFEQLLAMKLSAWRDDVDIADARRLLVELSGTYDDLWSRVSAHVQPGRELKAKYAFDDLWEQRRHDAD